MGSNRADVDQRNPRFKKILDSIQNFLPTTKAEWSPIVLILRGAVTSGLLLFSSLLVLIWTVVSAVFWLVVEGFAFSWSFVASLSALIVQSAFGASMTILREDELGIASFSTTLELVAIPTLLSIGIVFFVVIASRRVLVAIPKHRFAAILSFSAAFGFTVTALTWLMTFSTNRYSILPLDSMLPDFSIGLLSGTNALIVFAFVFIPALLGGLFSGGRRSKPLLGVGWYLVTLRAFVLSAFTLGLFVAVVYIAYRLLKVDFVSTQPNLPDVPVDWMFLTGFFLVFLLFLPTVLINAAWIFSGSVFGVLFDQNSIATLLEIVPLVSDISDFESFSLWDETPWVATAGLISMLLLALFSGAIVSRYFGWRPKSFWTLPGFVVLAISVALFIRRFSSIGVSARFEVADSGLSESDVAQALAVLNSESFEARVGVSEFAAVLLLIALSFSAFIGARYLSNWLPPVFPIWSNFLTGKKSASGDFENISPGQRITGRSIIAVSLCAAVFALAVAGTERVFSQIEVPQRHVERVAKLFLDPSLEVAKAVFDDSSQVEWLSDEVLEASRQSLPTEFQVETKNLLGTDWRPGELSAIAEVTFVGETDFSFSISIDGEERTHLFGVTSAEYSGLPTAPTIEVALPEVLSEAGVDEVIINGFAVAPGIYRVLPGFYKIETPGRGIVSPTEQTAGILAGAVQLSLQPEVILPQDIKGELARSLEVTVEGCSEVDFRGDSACFSVTDQSDEAQPLGDAPPADFYDFVENDFSLNLVGCENPRDTLDSAFSLTREQKCVWNIELTRTYFDTQVVRTPVMATGSRSVWVAECNWNSGGYYTGGDWDWEAQDYTPWVWNDTSSWSGCYQEESFEYQTGTTSRTLRGGEIYKGQFGSQMSASVKSSAIFKDGALEVGEAVFVRD